MRSIHSCSGASSTKVAPKIVSMRVVKTSMFGASAGPGPPGGVCTPEASSGNFTRAPSDRPIQFRCIVRTFSGHSVRRSVASSNSCA